MTALALLLLSLVAAPETLSERIDSLARTALDPTSLYTHGDTVSLYGIRTNGADTKQGRWACAKVTSIVLRRAGAMRSVVLGVRDVENALKGWERIDDEDSLRPGDVVVWTRRYDAPKDGSCIGGGTCHVGVQTSRGRFHNDPLLRRPSFDGIALAAFRFKSGYRPPRRTNNREGTATRHR